VIESPVSPEEMPGFLEEEQGRRAFEELTGRDDWDSLRTDTRRSWIARGQGDNAFIPPSRSVAVNEDETERGVPLPAAYRFAIVRWRPARPGEIPGGAAAVIKTARKHGWDVQVGYARGPWQSRGRAALIDPATGAVDDSEEGEDATGTDSAGKVPAIYEVIAVHARRGDQRVAATWTRKPWTKPGREGKYQFGAVPGVGGAHIWPPHDGGGLHNSKTLTDYLKETPCSTPSTT
jgi:hypothetical protein